MYSYLQPAEHFANMFVIAQEHFIAYCRLEEAVKLFQFLPSLFSLTGT
jgi:hypothetical protein